MVAIKKNNGNIHTIYSPGRYLCVGGITFLPRMAFILKCVIHHRNDHQRQQG